MNLTFSLCYDNNNNDALSIEKYRLGYAFVRLLNSPCKRVTVWWQAECFLVYYYELYWVLPRLLLHEKLVVVQISCVYFIFIYEGSLISYRLVTLNRNERSSPYNNSRVLVMYLFQLNTAVRSYKLYITSI